MSNEIKNGNEKEKINPSEQKDENNPSLKEKTNPIPTNPQIKYTPLSQN